MRLLKILPVALGLAVCAAAPADIIFLKDGSRYEGRVAAAPEPGFSVITTSDVQQARGIDPKRPGWKVEVREGAAAITLPKDQVEEVLDPSRDATPLVQALEHPDKRVRYAAAMALAGMRPARPFVGAEKVVRNLADAVGECGIRVVLVVTDDGDLANQLAARVRSAQAVPVQALSAYECLACLKRSPGKDAILLDAGLGRKGDATPQLRQREKDFEELDRRIKDLTHYQAGDAGLPVEKRYARELFLRLREDYRAKAVPVIVLAEDAEMDLVQRIYAGQRVAGFLPRSADETRVKAALAALFQRDDPALRDSKDLADEVSRSASRSLAALARNDPVFRVGDAEEALIRAFSEGTEPRRDDGVRIAALDAAASIGTPACIPAALKVLGSAANPAALRRSAARAVAAIAKADAGPLPEAAVAGLMEALKDPDAGVWQEAARGLGLSQIDLARVRDVWAQERLEKPLKE